MSSKKKKKERKAGVLAGEREQRELRLRGSDGHYHEEPWILRQEVRM